MPSSLVPQRESRATPKRPLAPLRRFFQHAHKIHEAATAVAANLRWFHVTKTRPIILLDFDVICGAIPRLATPHRLGQVNEGAGDLSLSWLWGPSMLKVMFQSVDEVLVPPGTAAELFTAIDVHSRPSLSQRAQTFMERITNASKSSDPGMILTDARYAHEKNLLLEDITRFDEDFQDYLALQNLLSKAIPAEELIDHSQDSRAGGSTDVKAFRGSYGFLNLKRPTHTLNNFNDALNAALVVRLFNSAIAGKGGSRVPILISETRAIRQLDSISNDYLRDGGLSDERPTLFSDSLFLVLGQGLLHSTQGRFGVAADEARQLAADAAILREECGGLIALGSDLDSTAEDLLQSPRARMLYHQKTLFDRKWGMLFAPFNSARQRDHLDYLRLLLSPQMRDVLASYGKEKFALLHEKLKECKIDDYALLDAILKHAEGEQSITTSLRAFEYRVVPNDGTLLRELYSVGTPGDAPIPSVSGTHDFRLVIAPAYVSAGIVFSIASFRDLNISSTRYISLTWLHKADTPTMFLELLKLLEIANKSAANINLSLFTSTVWYRDIVSQREAQQIGQYLLGEQPDPQQPIQQRFGECLRRMGEEDRGVSQFDFVRLEGPSAGVFADLQFLEGKEMQANLTIRVDDLTSDIYSALLETINATCEVEFTVAYLRLIFRDAWRMLEVEGLD